MKRKFEVLALVIVLSIFSVASAGLASNESFGTPNQAQVSLTKEEVREMKFRTEAGLNADIEFVKNSMTVYPISSKFGVHLSPVEESDLVDRFTEQEMILKQLEPILKKIVNDDYILFIDQASGGIINVGVKDLGIDLNHIKALFPDEKKLNIFKTEWSEKELDEKHDKIWNHKDDWKKQGIEIVEMSTNAFTQKVEIGLLDLTPEKKKLLHKNFGDSIEVREGNYGENHVDRSSTWNPMRGGVRISSSLGGSCSSAFMATDGLNKYVVTAAHCGVAGYYQGTNYIGYMTARNEAGSSDIAVIGGGPSGVSYSGGLIYTSPSQTAQYLYTEHETQDTVGELACMSGASTPTNSVQCGFIQSVNYSGTFAGIAFRHLRTASYTSVNGDSGGTVFRVNTLKGINKGHTGSGLGVYSQMARALSDLNARYNPDYQIIF